MKIDKDINNNDLKKNGDVKMTKIIMSPLLGFVAGALFLVGVLYLLSGVATTITDIKETLSGLIPMAVGVLLLYMAIRVLGRRR